MTNRTIKHEVKLQKSVIIILAVLAFGVCANAFAPAFEIRDAKAGQYEEILIAGGLNNVANALRNISACSN